MGSLRGDFVWGFGYGSNWYQLYVGQGYAAQGVFTPLRHLWSLAVEEQFYLLWPLVMVVLLRKGSERLPRVAMRLFMVAVAIAVLVAVLYVPGTIGSEPSLDTHGYWKAPLGWLPFMEDRWISVNETLYLSTFTRAGGLMLGAAFAMVWRPLAVMRGPLRKRGRRIDLLALLALVGLVLMVRGLALAEESSEALFASEYDPWLFRGGFFLTGLCSVLLIAAATHRRSRIGRLLGMRPLRWVGTRSYGLYLYHWPVYEVLRGDDAHLDGTRFVLAMLVTVPVAELSYRVVELPVRHGRLGQWLRGQRPARTVRMKARRRNAVVFGGAMAVLAGFAAVSVARAQILCVTDIECDRPAKRSSVRCCRSSRTTPRRRRSRSPTTRSTASLAGCGAATPTTPKPSPGASAPARWRSTAARSTSRRRSAGTSRAASAAKAARSASKSSPRSRPLLLT